jgi:nickel-dependent lactate racemase
MLNRRHFLAAPLAAGVTLSAQTWDADSNVQTIPLRTHEWFGDTLESFECPRDWQIELHEMAGVDAPPLNRKQIREAINAPVGTKDLPAIASGKRTVAIAFDDLSRATPTYAVVSHLIEILRGADIADENILFVAAHGARREMNGVDGAKKLGPETVHHHPWVNHNVWENHADLGTTAAGTPVRVNSYFRQADVRITVSGLQVEGVLGYTGGPETILPGLAGMRSIRRLRALERAQPESGNPPVLLGDNAARREMAEAARRVGVDFSVQVVCNHERQPVKIVAGDIVEAHREAARYAVNHLATECATDADIVVVNAYPNGARLYQPFGWARYGLKDGGSIVVVNQNPIGASISDASEEGPQGNGSYFVRRDARKPRFPNARQVLLYSQYLQARELDRPDCPPETVGLRQWNDVIQMLGNAHPGDGVKVAVYPYAGIQHPPARLTLPA